MDVYLIISITPFLKILGNFYVPALKLTLNNKKLSFKITFGYSVIRLSSTFYIRFIVKIITKFV
jgi:hypothetical protein